MLFLQFFWECLLDWDLGVFDWARLGGVVGVWILFVVLWRCGVVKDVVFCFVFEHLGVCSSAASWSRTV